jgi:hypothetical protein
MVFKGGKLELLNRKMLARPFPAHTVADLVMVLGKYDKLTGRNVSRKAAMPTFSES